MGQDVFLIVQKKHLDRKKIKAYTCTFAFSEMTRELKRKRIPMLTNLTNRFETHAATSRTLWALAGMPGAASSVYCLGSIPTGFSIGGGLLQEAELNSLQAKFDSRQLQM
jgi:hypothetical protein